VPLAESTPNLDEYLPKVEVVTKLHWARWGNLLSGYMEFNDLYHVGVEAMILAYPRWDQSRGSFWNFAAHRIKGALIDSIRSDKHIPVERASRLGDWLHLQPLADLDGGDEDRCLNTATQHPVDTKLLSSMLSALYPREVEIVYLRYYEDVTLTEIGNRLGITESRVHQLHDEIMRKLKRRLMYSDIVVDLSYSQLVDNMVADRRRRCIEQSERRINHL